ncbi:hypothetical protein N9D66_02190, partial [Candidatus Nanopelagicales bacterium]|nr:hypothetical protein [Candidatus Nanopelagicales bacterium]
MVKDDLDARNTQKRMAASFSGQVARVNTWGQDDVHPGETGGEAHGVLDDIGADRAAQTRGIDRNCANRWSLASQPFPTVDKGLVLSNRQYILHYRFVIGVAGVTRVF